MPWKLIWNYNTFLNLTPLTLLTALGKQFIVHIIETPHIAILIMGLFLSLNFSVIPQFLKVFKLTF